MAGSSGRRRGRVGMSVVGALLSFVISAQHAGRDGAEGRSVEGRLIVETMVTESLGGFRNLARIVFLIVAVADVER